MGEVLTGRSVAGAALILGGVLLVELKPSAKQPHPHG
jgi:drug/metabolite transporter (DMT)-like permease